MAVTTLYFGAASAGADDGTSWANRKAFVVSGAVNTAITAFNFTSNSLIAYVGPGTYAITTGLTTFTVVAPTSNLPCEIKACDSSGNEWVPPDLGWTSAEPAWDDTNMPVFQTTTNIVTISHGGVCLYGIKFTASGRTAGSFISNALRIAWCIGISSASNASAVAISSAVQLENCVFKCTGDIYSTVVNLSSAIPVISNIRFEGNPNASSGGRFGYYHASNSTSLLVGCTSIGNVGGGFTQANVGSAGRITLRNCVAANNGAYGVSTAGTSNVLHYFSHCMITGSGMTNGINITGTGQAQSQFNRIRDYSGSAIFGGLDTCVPPKWGNITTAGTDADEYVDAASGDYRIKNTSDYWGKNLGAGDQPAAGAGDYTFAQVKQLRYKMRQGART